MVSDHAHLVSAIVPEYHFAARSSRRVGSVVGACRALGRGSHPCAGGNAARARLLGLASQVVEISGRASNRGGGRHCFRTPRVCGEAGNNPREAGNKLLFSLAPDLCGLRNDDPDHLATAIPRNYWSRSADCTSPASDKTPSSSACCRAARGGCGARGGGMRPTSVRLRRHPSRRRFVSLRPLRPSRPSRPVVSVSSCSSYRCSSPSLHLAVPVRVHLRPSLTIAFLSFPVPSSPSPQLPSASLSSIAASVPRRSLRKCSAPTSSILLRHCPRLFVSSGSISFLLISAVFVQSVLLVRPQFCKTSTPSVYLVQAFLARFPPVLLGLASFELLSTSENSDITLFLLFFPRCGTESFSWFVHASLSMKLCS